MTSKLTINLVVILLGVTLLGTIGGAIGLAAAHDTIPEQLWTVGSTALGALAAVLVSTRAGDVVAPVPAPPADVPDPEPVQGP